MKKLILITLLASQSIIAQAHQTALFEKNDAGQLYPKYLVCEAIVKGELSQIKLVTDDPFYTRAGIKNTTTIDGKPYYGFTNLSFTNLNGKPAPKAPFIPKTYKGPMVPKNYEGPIHDFPNDFITINKFFVFFNNNDFHIKITKTTEDSLKGEPCFRCNAPYVTETTLEYFEDDVTIKYNCGTDFSYYK